MKTRSTVLALAAALACAAWAHDSSAQRKDAAAQKMPAALKPALDSISSDDILRHTKALSSDEFEGRGPGTRGEELTVAYLTEQMKRIGLKPGNPDGTYVQKVPLVGMKADPSMSVEAGGKRIDMKFPDDFVAVSRRNVAETKVSDSDLVFVGYGVVAPEYGWDDYKGVDVRGKTIVMLINDPAVPDPSDPSKPDERMFKGKAMTYYGRWTYKYEIASEKGAAAAIIVHETGPAGYPFEVVKGSWGQENFDIIRADKNMGRVGIESWVTLDRAREIFSAGGHDFDALKRAAVRKDFKPVALNAKLNASVKNTLREVQSNNVVGKLEGSDPKLRDEYVVYSAHWDHLGKNEKLQGDQIYNGAIDNASGVAQVLEIAEGFAKLPRKPKRSILFLFVTAEEKGLLGAKHYAENPLYPLHKTLANINIDGANQWGRTSDVVIIGDGNSTLDDLAREVLALQGRKVMPDPETEKGFYYRSDHFEFAKQGVPALYLDTGTEFVGKSPEFSKQKREEYTNNDYHKPSDEVKPDWDLTGAAEDARLLLAIGHRVAEGSRFPEWKPGTEFKAKRDATMRAAAGRASK
ncbi:MAG TPA: M28 family metallopeptidase [Pyrinomonadaceae bacterium]|nr:M28 family metallopeptidase [Pyrinomonadaceae bacterium]